MKLLIALMVVASCLAMTACQEDVLVDATHKPTAPPDAPALDAAGIDLAPTDRATSHPTTVATPVSLARYEGISGYVDAPHFQILFDPDEWSIEPYLMMSGAPESLAYQLVHRQLPSCVLFLQEGARQYEHLATTNLAGRTWDVDVFTPDRLVYMTLEEGFNYLFSLRLPQVDRKQQRQSCIAHAETVLATFAIARPDSDVLPSTLDASAASPRPIKTPTSLPTPDPLGFVTLVVLDARLAATPFAMRYAANRWTLVDYHILVDSRGPACSLWLAPTRDRSDSAPISDEVELTDYVWGLRRLPDEGVIIYETKLDNDRMYRFQVNYAVGMPDDFVAGCLSRAEKIFATFQPIVDP